MKRPHIHLCPVEKPEAGPANGPPARSDALAMLGGPGGNPQGRPYHRAHSRAAREGPPGVLGGEAPWPAVGGSTR